MKTTTNKKYIEKAKNLNTSGFCVVGYGYFDITNSELAQILQYVEKDNFHLIKKLYERLEKERL